VSDARCDVRRRDGNPHVPAPDWSCRLA
jgi:hypothetical protein